MSASPPKLIIVAGANGSGETTFAVPYTAEIGVEFLDADILAREFADRGEKQAMFKGGRAFFRLLNQALAERRDVVIETTLSGTYTGKVAQKAAGDGYTIEMIYIFLESPEVCVD